MSAMRSLLIAVALACALAPLRAQEPDAAAIMSRVAANQDRSEAERVHYIYVQHAKVTSHKGKTVRCEEITDSRVTPTESGSAQQLLKLDGRLLSKGKYVPYTQPPQREKNEKSGKDDEDLNVSIDNGDTDRDLVENFRNNFTNSRSKDGIGAGLFPLTTKTQSDYQFNLLGREHLNGREVFHLTFKPKDKDEFAWKGDAYIDTTAYQPVLVRTAMSRKIPFAVRTLLGTSLPGLGFTVIYAPQPKDEPGAIWFPISFGTEFKMHILFFFNREISLSADNREFEKTHVNSKIVAVAPTDAATPQP
jgi:hypothetical protein